MKGIENIVMGGENKGEIILPISILLSQSKRAGYIIHYSRKTPSLIEGSALCSPSNSEAGRRCGGKREMKGWIKVEREIGDFRAMN